MKIVTQDIVNEVDSKREVHHLTARKELEEEYLRRERILRGDYVNSITVKGVQAGTYRPLDRLQDPGAMRKELRDYKRNYERGMPIKLSPHVRNQLWKKAKWLKDEFVIGMVSRRDMHPVKSMSVTASDGTSVIQNVADYDRMYTTKSIERHKVWTKRNQKKVDEFKRIMRMLEPDNPDIANVERFRKE